MPKLLRFAFGVASSCSVHEAVPDTVCDHRTVASWAVLTLIDSPIPLKNACKEPPRIATCGDRSAAVARLVHVADATSATSRMFTVVAARFMGVISSHGSMSKHRLRRADVNTAGTAKRLQSARLPGKVPVPGRVQSE